MLPFSFPTAYHPTQANMYQAYQNMVNFNMMSSMMLMSQERMLQAQFYNMMHMQDHYLRNNIKAQQSSCYPQATAPEPSSPLSATLTPISVTPKIPEEKPLNAKPISVEISKKTEAPKKQPPKRRSKKNLNLPFLRKKLQEMIPELLNRLKIAESEEISMLREKYSEDPSLLMVFDSIVTKYLSIKKNKEDIIRYVIRKALKCMKNDIIKKDKLYGKRAYAVLCKRYFHVSPEELTQTGVDLENEDDLIEVLLPYRRNSKNKTMNTSFTSELFASKEFCEDYQQFLKVFDKVLDEDNSKKIPKLVALAEECIVKNCTNKIKNCTRLPWLQVWLEKTHEIAQELPRLRNYKGEEHEVEDEEHEIEKRQKFEL